MLEKDFEAVFISDLHLSPQEPLITKRFEFFIQWAAKHTKSVYILGDFFHAWAGDDDKESWSDSISQQLRWLAEQKVSIFYLHGNRDFLLGQDFANEARMTILKEPTLINLENTPVLLVHGDRYCTKDKSHQWFRRLTRNPWFTRFFLLFPLKFRKKLVATVRQHSQTNHSKTIEQMDIVPQPMLRQMDEYKVTILIHGHTHKPGLRKHWYNERQYNQYTLSDWDDSPQLLCYNKSYGLYFNHDVFGVI